MKGASVMEPLTGDVVKGGEIEMFALPFASCFNVVDDALNRTNNIVGGVSRDGLIDDT